MNKWIERAVTFAVGIGVGAGATWFVLDRKYAKEVAEIAKETAVDRAELQKARKAYLDAINCIKLGPRTFVEAPTSSEVVETDKDRVKVEVTTRPVVTMTRYDQVKLPDPETLMSDGHYEGGPNHDGYTGVPAHIFGEVVPDYELVEYDYDTPIGYDSDTLEYFMQSDTLVNDNEETYDDIAETIGHEAYEIISSKEGPIYICSHKHKMLYEVRAIDADYAQYMYDPSDELSEMPEDLKEAIRTGKYKPKEYPESNPPVNVINAQFSGKNSDGTETFSVFDPEYQARLAKATEGQRGISMEEYENMSDYERMKRRQGSYVEK